MLKKLLFAAMFSLCCSIAFGASYTKSKLPYEKKLKVYKYYSKAEDVYGLETAYAKTTKMFNISEKEVIRIKTEGVMEDWLGEFTECPSNKSSQQIQREKDEMGSELYKAAEKKRTGRKHNRSQKHET